MSKRIALLGITHESNSFVKNNTTLENFYQGHFFKGEEIRLEYANAFHEIGGMIEVVENSGMELVPVMYAEATPGGVITSECYEYLINELLVELEKVMPIDGCLVVPHGAGICEKYRDMDGHWLGKLREKLGKDIPIIGTIDPHANLSKAMIDATDALVAYKTNPHIDQREVGKEAALLMIQRLKHEVFPLQVMTQLPLAISIEQQLTQKDPCKCILELIQKNYHAESILSISLVLGFPYADVEEMGSSIIVVTDNNLPAANKMANKISEKIISIKNQFNSDKKDVHTQVSTLPSLQKPVLLLDMGDNVGGGSDGNSTSILDALESFGFGKSFICIHDPEAVAKVVSYEIGANLDLEIGQIPILGNSSKYRVALLEKCDGVFTEDVPRHGGQLKFNMGKIAIVKTEIGNTIMLTSLRVPPYSLRQLTAFNLDPINFDAIIAKGVNAPIAAYKVVCKTILQVNSPGTTQADMTKFQYQFRRKPLFPFEA